MIRNDVDVTDLEVVIQKANEAIKKNPDLAAKLVELRKKLETMKVASLEWADLRNDFERGNITTEDYQVQSKKLRMDMERARNEANLLTIIHEIKNEEKKSKLLRLKDAIVSNKDLIRVALEVLKSMI